MSDTLLRIKRAVLAGRFEFSRKAAEEMDTDDLTRLHVVESMPKLVLKPIISLYPPNAPIHRHD